jgi:hypothetical protein
MSYNSLESRSYTLYLSSADKISGTNNNATFAVNWNELLPQAFNEYKMIFCVSTAGGYYKDGTTLTYSIARVKADFGGARQFCYDTSTSGPGTIIGTVQRDQQTSTSSSNVLSCFYYQNPAKTIARPTQNTLTLSFTNMSNNSPLVTTDSAGTAQSDMTSYVAQFEFIPVRSSLNQPRQFQDL